MTLMQWSMTGITRPLTTDGARLMLTVFFFLAAFFWAVVVRLVGSSPCFLRLVIFVRGFLTMSAHVQFTDKPAGQPGGKPVKVAGEAELSAKRCPLSVSRLLTAGKGVLGEQ